MTLAGFIASQRTDHGVPHAVACRALEVSESWLYKWLNRETPPPSLARRQHVDRLVAEAFEASGGTYGSPRVHAELAAAGEKVNVKTVAASMARQDLVARQTRRRKGLTRPDKAAVPFKDLIGRDFTAPAPNLRWVGDMTEIPTRAGKLYLATVIDLYSRRLLGYATSLHPDADLACAAIRMAVAARGGPGPIAGVIFHTDRGSTYTAGDFTQLCRTLHIVQSMGRVGSCFDNAAAESFFSTLEWEVQSRHDFTDPDHARSIVVPWICDFYNPRRRHSSCNMRSPIEYEQTSAREHARDNVPSTHAA